MKKLPSLKSDFVFKTLFERHTEDLVKLVNAVLKLPKGEKIEKLELKNPIQGKQQREDKTVIFDINAFDEKGRNIIIEMQAYSQNFFYERACFYANKAYINQLKESEK